MKNLPPRMIESIRRLLNKTRLTHRRRPRITAVCPAAAPQREVGQLLCPSEGAAAAAAPAVGVPSLATLIAGHILRDGEIVQLILKPSLWFILFNSMFFSAAVLIVSLGAILSDGRFGKVDRFYVEAATFLIACRVMESFLQWMGRVYILTDLRIVRLSGVFTIEIFDCPLRKVAHTRMVSTFREKLVGTGSIEILPQDDWPGLWQTIAQPKEVEAIVLAAIGRAKQSGMGGEE